VWFYAGLKTKHVLEDKKNKRSTELDGGGEYLVFSISLSLHREGRQRKDGSLS
jgi:hypothetical protein